MAQPTRSRAVASFSSVSKRRVRSRCSCSSIACASQPTERCQTVTKTGDSKTASDMLACTPAARRCGLHKPECLQLAQQPYLRNSFAAGRRLSEMPAKTSRACQRGQRRGGGWKEGRKRGKRASETARESERRAKRACMHTLRTRYRPRFAPQSLRGLRKEVEKKGLCMTYMALMPCHAQRRGRGPISQAARGGGRGQGGRKQRAQRTAAHGRVARHRPVCAASRNCFCTALVSAS